MEEPKVRPLSGATSPSRSPKRPPPPPVAARVKVAVRVRPLTCPSASGEDPSPMCVTQADPETGANSSDNTLHFQLEKMQKSFRFDHVFSSDAAQADVYNGALQPLLASLLHGFNVTVLAYGQTGSGKTYTVGGAETSAPRRDDDDGLIPRFLRDLFEALRNEKSVKTTAKVSFLEIYCDDIRDLLVDGGERARSSTQNGTRQSSGPRLAIHEDDHDVWVEGLQLVNVKGVDEALDLLTTGRQRQTIGAHALNDHSSRSHAVYTLEVTRAFANEIKRAKLTFVDLAGSERVKKTLMEGQGMKEGSHINIGLLALGNVINALGSRQRLLQRRNSTGVSGRRSSISGSDDIAPLGAAHVPYRSSKLTRLLRDALGGNSVTLFIACVSPDITNGNETLCTLQYANRARTIQNKAQKNVEEATTEDLVDGDGAVLHSTESEREIYALREQVTALKSQLSEAIAAAKAVESRNPTRVEIANDGVNSSGINPTTTKNPRSAQTRRRRRITPLEFDSIADSRASEAIKCSEPSQRVGVVNKSSRQLREESFATHFNITSTTDESPLEDPKPQVPDVPQTFSPAESSSNSPSSSEEVTRHIPLSASKSTGDSHDKALSGRDLGAMIDQGTQYEFTGVQHERKTPIDYVLLSPSQIFREVHDQKVLAGTPSPWPHRRRLDTVQEKESSPAASVSSVTLNQKNTPCAKCAGVLEHILRRAQQLVEDTLMLPDDGIPEVKDDQLSHLSVARLVDRMASLSDKRRRQQQKVRRLLQRFQHLSTLLGADVGTQKSELLKYTLEHQQLALQQHLQACELVVAERLWMRLQHREIAIETYAETWNDKLAEAFLSDDQYEACVPWHQYHDDHEFFQHHILPFVLNGWISVAPEDLENEQIWLSL